MTLKQLDEFIMNEMISEETKESFQQDWNKASCKEHFIMRAVVLSRLLSDLITQAFYKEEN